MDGSDRSDWLMLSTLQHYAYCPRQASLLRDGVWADNHLTVRGSAGHEKVDGGGVDRRRGVRVHHRVSLVSVSLGIHGVADAVEEDGSGQLMPVEHKRGRGAGDLFPSLVQVVAQALCLEEMTGQDVRRVSLYITKERHREVFETNQYRQRVIELIGEARVVLAGDVPACYVARLCSSCSVQNACQPRGAQWR